MLIHTVFQVAEAVDDLVQREGRVAGTFTQQIGRLPRRRRQQQLHAVWYPGVILITDV